MQITKILSYNVYGNHTSNRFQHVCDLLSQKSDPQSDELDSLDCKNNIVYTSPLARAVSCIAEKTVREIHTEKALSEIPFALDLFCSEEEFFHGGSTAVRKAFIIAFSQNALLLSHEILQNECDQILSIANTQRTTLCVSHSFRMKVLQAYIQYGTQLFRDPLLIKKYINPKNKMFNFGDSIYI